MPDIFVSVVIVQGSEQAPDGLASFKMGLIKLPVAVAAKELTITLTPDKDMAKGEHYGPRQTATYDVLVTDSAGKPVEAELSLRLADLAVLALADEPGPSLVEAFWRSRGLGVRTSMALVVAMEPFNRELKPGLKGGGGGEEGGLVRSRFADTAFWDPTVRTGKDGKAQVTVDLPDNLTTWRMQAKGITADTLVGQTNVDILSSLDLLVRAELPRFFVVGDKAQIGTIVHNNTKDKLAVQVNVGSHRTDPGRPGQPDGRHRGRRQGRGHLAGHGPAGERGQGADVGQRRRPVRRPRGHAAGVSLLDAGSGGHRRPPVGGRPAAGDHPAAVATSIPRWAS